MMQNSAVVFGVSLPWQKTFFSQELRIHSCGEVMTGRQARMLMSCMVAFWTSLCVKNLNLSCDWFLVKLADGKEAHYRNYKYYTNYVVRRSVCPLRFS